jgi:hypothetical protein
MNRRWFFLDSGWLTAAILVALVAVIGLHLKITADSRADVAVSERWWQATHQAFALAHAIEQYCIDFPDCGPLGNSREWTARLGGKNSKGIRYLKVEKYSRDSDSKLLDPCGSPWIIDVEGSPESRQMVAPEPIGKFRVWSDCLSGTRLRQSR